MGLKRWFNIHKIQKLKSSLTQAESCIYRILLSLFTETVVKTVRREHDVTRICNKESQTTIVLIICKIKRQRDTGGECHLLYRHGENVTQECDPRFSITKENQTAFLELTSLTPADSGNFTCECTNTEGTYIVHISVTVEGKCILVSLSDTVIQHCVSIVLTCLCVFYSCNLFISFLLIFTYSSLNTLTDSFIRYIFEPSWTTFSPQTCLHFLWHNKALKTFLKDSQDILKLHHHTVAADLSFFN